MKVLALHVAQPSLYPTPHAVPLTATRDHSRAQCLGVSSEHCCGGLQTNSSVHPKESHHESWFLLPSRCVSLRDTGKTRTLSPQGSITPPGLGGTHSRTWYSSTCCSFCSLNLRSLSSARKSKTGSGTASRSSDVLKSIWMLWELGLNPL